MSNRVASRFWQATEHYKALWVPIFFIVHKNVLQTLFQNS